jgi:adenylylsulfate kinase
LYIETHTRAVIKTISWRILATLTTATIVFILVGKIEIAAIAGGTEMILKIIFYYFHERIWNRIHIGKKQITPFVLWFTGLSGSGKSTLANLLYNKLVKKGYKVERLDGDTVRSIFPQTGFTREDRNSHIKRIGYLASILEKNGVIVIASFISPYKESREFVRGLCKNFIEVYVDTSIEECERRDVKGLYKKARAGEIKNFTGINDPYEIPEYPEIIVRTDDQSLKVSMEKIEECIKRFFDGKLNSSKI